MGDLSDVRTDKYTEEKTEKSRAENGSEWLWLPSWSGEETEQICMVFFRKVIQAEKIPEHLYLHISADSRYKLYVNGRFAEWGPSKGNDKIWYYDEIDLAPWLSPGENVLAVEVLRYPALHWRGNCSTFRTPVPGLYIRPCGSPEEELLLKGSWKCRKREGFQIVPENRYFAPMKIYETVSPPEEEHGWKLPGYTDDSWEDAREYGEEDLSSAPVLKAMQPRTIPFGRRKKRRFCGVKRIEQSRYNPDEWNAFLEGKTEIRIPPHTKETVEIDAGELMTGFLRLAVLGGKAGQICLLQSECYAGEIRQNKDPFKCMPVKGDRTDSVHGKLYGYTDRYTVSGKGDREIPELYEPFWFRTFRFIRLEIETEEEELILAGFDYEETGYPLEISAEAEVSDPSMKGIWDICERTLRRCMHETYMDCPFYEQLQYAMDSRSQILYTYASSGDDRLARKCMDDFLGGVREDGLTNSCCPNYEANVIPGFSVYYIGMVYDHMMYFGDKELIRRHLPAIRGILGHFDSHLDERGLVGKIGDLNGTPGQFWSFVDWAPEWAATTGVPPATRKGPVTMESFLYILGLQYAGALCEYLGLENESREYRDRASAVAEGVKTYCRGERGMFQDGPGTEDYSQHCQVFAVLTETVSSEEGRRLLKETLDHPSDYAQCSVAMMFYLFRALERCGLYGYTDRLWDLWREMVKNHMTTCAEDSLESRSDCHAWGALALYELPAAVLGVRPGKPGWEEILVSPVPSHLKWARGEVPTGKGKVSVSWEREEEDRIHLHISAPRGARIRIPGKENLKIEEGDIEYV